MDWLLNNPIVLTLIVLAVVLIAVGLILYFLVFRKKIKSAVEKNKEKRVKLEQENESAVNLAAGIFANKDTEQVKEKEKAKKEPINLNERLKVFTKPAEIKSKQNEQEFDDETKLDDKSEEVINNALAYMNQFKEGDSISNFTNNSSNSKKDNKSDSEVLKGMTSYMNQFNTNKEVEEDPNKKKVIVIEVDEDEEWKKPKPKSAEDVLKSVLPNYSTNKNRRSEDE